MTIKTKKPETSGKVGEVSTSPREMQKNKPEPAQAARAKISPDEQKKLDRELMENSRDGNAKEVKRLIKAGANVNSERMPPLLWAAIEGHLEIAKILIENGADVNGRGVTGATPLRGAAAQSNLEVAELLIASGADVNSRADDGTTILEMANEHSIPEISELLQKHGAKE